MIDIDELVSGVQRYARNHYYKGWDCVVDGWEPDRIARVIQGAQSVGEAIDDVAEYVDMYNDDLRRMEAFLV